MGKIKILIIILIGGGFVIFLFLNSGDEKSASLNTLASPLEVVSDLDELIKKAGGAKYVLLGESSHGTSEYYQWRAEITKRLITEKGFSFIVVEGDWPYIYQINQYVKGYAEAPSNAKTALLASASDRWPDWMWANEEFLELVEWLHTYNKNLPAEERIGLYGMDMQDLSASLKIAKGSGEFDYECLQAYGKDIVSYAQAHADMGVNCEQEANVAMEKLYSAYERKEILASPELFNVKQNILAVKYGEQYARDMVLGGARSWNTRVRFMKETVGRLSERYGEGGGIVWAHNTHVGDARATEMLDAGVINIGQLLREKHGEEKIFIVGFGTYKGTVVAGQVWGGARMVQTVPPAIQGSVEDLLAGLDMPAFILLFDRGDVPEILLEKIGHRAKGVVYNPENEQLNYVPTVLHRRYNAFIFLEETTALNPLNLE